MIETNIDTTNVLILEDFFNKLSHIDQKRIFTNGFRRAARPLTQKAKADAPKGKTGNLRRSIGSLMVKDDIAIIIGAKKFGRYKGHHGHLVEDGTAPRVRKSGGSTGTMPGNGFFENAYKSTYPKIRGDIQDEWYKEIDKYIIRVNKKFK